MKAFEEWYKNPDSAIPFSSKCGTKELFEVVWKAALKWVLSEGIDDWIEDSIIRELDNDS